jgi:AraC-like DNA-binding protein
LKFQRAEKRILFENGFWWFCMVRNNRAIRYRLCFQSAGWRVSVLCANLGVAERTFDRVVASSLGVPAKRWLRELRAVEAGYLLLEYRKVTQVASMLGFSNVSGFSREFSRTIGQSPTDFLASRLPPDW